MGEVNGNRISTSFLLPEFAAISIGVIQPCYVKHKAEIFMEHDHNMCQQKSYMVHLVSILETKQCNYQDIAFPLLQESTMLRVLVIVQVYLFYV
jgi:hypothetical protein